MRLGSIIAACLLAAGLTVPVAATPATAGEEPYRWFDLTTPGGPVLQHSETTVTLAGWNSHPTSGSLQARTGDDGWTDLQDVTFLALTGGDAAVELEMPIPTATVGTYELRFLLDAGPDYPRTEVAGWGPSTIEVVQPPPTDVLPSTVTVSALPTSHPRFGEHVTLEGRVSGGLAREVVVELATPRGWMTMAGTTSDRGGDYRLAVPTDWYFSGRVRVAAPKVRVGDVLHEAASSPGERLRVAVPYRTRGKASDWSTLFGGREVVSRWDPCRTITWKVNTAGAPPGALATVKRAMRLVHAATGLSFGHRGRTRAIPYRTDGGKQWDRDADLVIAWASPRQKREFKGRWSAIGYGGHSSSNGESVRGGVVLDRTWDGRRGFPGASWGSLLLHEIGHAVGLGHAAGPAQVMYWQMQRDASGRYEAGDLSGLRRLGAVNGCLPAEDAASRRSVERLVTVVSE